MKLELYQVDAFTNELFKGNPAAVCPLEKWLPDAILQDIASENNLSETAFFVKTSEGFRIRWFTPVLEVDLCGHATLATAHIIFKYLNYSSDRILFNSRSGRLDVRLNGNNIILNFPSDSLQEVPLTTELTDPFEIKPIKALRGNTDYMLVFENESTIKDLSIDQFKLSKISARGVIVTAPGDDCDFVSRFFAPQSGILEDPVTGSAHTTLTPYWSKILGKKSMEARQLSPRGGELYCSLLGDRVEIGGQAVTYLKGVFSI